MEAVIIAERQAINKLSEEHSFTAWSLEATEFEARHYVPCCALLKLKLSQDLLEACIKSKKAAGYCFVQARGHYRLRY